MHSPEQEVKHPGWLMIISMQYQLSRVYHQGCKLFNRPVHGYRGRLLKAIKGICPEFQVMRGFSQKIPADLLSYDQIHS